MSDMRAEDCCPGFTATVSLEERNSFRWGVILDGPQGTNLWGIATEIQSGEKTDRYREFTLVAAPDGATTRQDYYLTYARRLGARKFFQGGAAVPDVQFSVWAPNATDVTVVFGDPANGYIDDQESRKHPTLQDLPLQQAG